MTGALATRRRVRAAALAALAVPMLTACADPEPRPRTVGVTGSTMGTTFSVTVVASCVDDADEDRVVAALEPIVTTALDGINRVASTYIDDSEISRFNASAVVGEAFVVGPAFRALLAASLELARVTDGAFDPTVLPLVRALDFGPDRDDTPPTDVELAAARARVGFELLDVDADGNPLRKRAGVELDFSAIAKGQGVDDLSDALAAAGYGDHLVEVGGEVRCRGVKPDGSSWRVGVERPNADGSRIVFRAYALDDLAMATSGNYRNFHEREDRRVHHILDPRTGANAPTRVVSVSVVAPTCALADALATAFMVLGPDVVEPVFEHYAPARIGALFLVATDDGAVELRPLRWLDDE